MLRQRRLAAGEHPLSLLAPGVDAAGLEEVAAAGLDVLRHRLVEAVGDEAQLAVALRRPGRRLRELERDRELLARMVEVARELRQTDVPRPDHVERLAERPHPRRELGRN